jgi:hypothetical protein
MQYALYVAECSAWQEIPFRDSRLFDVLCTYAGCEYSPELSKTHEDPAAAVSKLTLDAKYNTRHKLKAIPPLTSFCHLVHLDVSGNMITELSGLESFTLLEELIVSRNALRALGGIWQCKRLRTLDVSGNFLKHIPVQLASLESLEQLNLCGNQLSILPEVCRLSPLKNLHTLQVEGNKLVTIHNYQLYCIVNLAALKFLDLVCIDDNLRRRSTQCMSTEKKSARGGSQDNMSTAELERENNRLRHALDIKSHLLESTLIECGETSKRLSKLENELAFGTIERIEPQTTVDASRQFPLSAQLEDEDRAHDSAPIAAQGKEGVMGRTLLDLEEHEKTLRRTHEGLCSKASQAAKDLQQVGQLARRLQHQLDMLPSKAPLPPDVQPVDGNKLP